MGDVCHTQACEVYCHRKSNIRQFDKERYQAPCRSTAWQYPNERCRTNGSLRTKVHIAFRFEALRGQVADTVAEPARC